MNESLRQHIAEHYDSGSWDAITGIIWDGGIPWQLTKFEREVEYSGSVQQCIIVTRVVYDPIDPTAVVEAEDIFAVAFVPSVTGNRELTSINYDQLKMDGYRSLYFDWCTAEEGNQEKPVTDIVWENGTPWRLVVVEADFEYYGTWHGVVVHRFEYDHDDPSVLVATEMVFSAEVKLD